MARAKKTVAKRGGANRNQVGALCWRKQAGKVRLLMITSRTTGRWILPKGWMMASHSADGAAAIEAWEEAGVKGKIRSDPIGAYRYAKVGDKTKPDRLCNVEVFPLKVNNLETKWPEMHQRRRRWMSRKRAAARVWEPELSRMIKQFDPRQL